MTKLRIKKRNKHKSKENFSKDSNGHCFNIRPKIIQGKNAFNRNNGISTHKFQALYPINVKRFFSVFMKHCKMLSYNRQKLQ